MIANPAISAGWFPGSDTGYQGVRRVVQDRLLSVCRGLYAHGQGVLWLYTNVCGVVLDRSWVPVSCLLQLYGNSLTGLRF